MALFVILFSGRSRFRMDSRRGGGGFGRGGGSRGGSRGDSRFSGRGGRSSDGWNQGGSEDRGSRFGGGRGSSDQGIVISIQVCHYESYLYSPCFLKFKELKKRRIEI